MFLIARGGTSVPTQSACCCHRHVFGLVFWRDVRPMKRSFRTTDSHSTLLRLLRSVEQLDETSERPSARDDVDEGSGSVSGRQSRRSEIDLIEVRLYQR